MNLGDVYLKAFFSISGLAILVAVAIPIVVRAWKRIHAGWLIAIFIVVSIALVFVGNSLFHHSLFVSRHMAQNQWVPKTGCTSYEPSFGHLFATYSMSRDDFDSWATSHPWNLQPYNLELFDRDSVRFGMNAPDASYATEMAENGNQLRVYFKDGTMYLSYNVM